MRSRGRMLVLISTIWAQRTKWTLTRALIGGAQPMEGWWAPVAQPHKREVRTNGTNDEVHRCHCSPPQTLIRSERVGRSGGKHHWHSYSTAPPPSCLHCTDRRRPCADLHRRMRDSRHLELHRRRSSPLLVSVIVLDLGPPLYHVKKRAMKSLSICAVCDSKSLTEERDNNTGFLSTSLEAHAWRIMTLNAKDPTQVQYVNMVA